MHSFTRRAMKRDFCFFREKKRKKKSSWKIEKTSTRWKQEKKQGSVPKQERIPNNIMKMENKHEDVWKKKIQHKYCFSLCIKFCFTERITTKMHPHKWVFLLHGMFFKGVKPRDNSWQMEVCFLLFWVEVVSAMLCKMAACEHKHNCLVNVQKFNPVLNGNCNSLRHSQETKKLSAVEGLRNR